MQAIGLVSELMVHMLGDMDAEMKELQEASLTDADMKGCTMMNVPADTAHV